jgi:hypothetical protein
VLDKNNPFGDVENEARKMVDRQLAVVKELDELENDVTSWEADFLENVIVQLRDRKIPLHQGQIDVVHQMCERYDVDCDF